jgi:dihydrofolate reductase
VLASERPPGTPDDVVVESDPERLLEQLRAANQGRDVHLIGGPQTVEIFRRLGALDELGLLVMRFLLGDGMRLTPAVSTDASLELIGARPVPGGAVEVVYSVA